MLEWTNSSDWMAAGNERRSGAAITRGFTPPFLDRAEKDGTFVIVEQLSGSPADSGRRAAAQQVRVTASVPDDGDYILAVRYPSGALRFVAPLAGGANDVRRSDASRRGRKIHFDAPAPVVTGEVGRRAFGDSVRKVIDTYLIRISGFIDEVLVGPAERAIWRLLDRQPGLRLVTRQGLATGALELATAPPIAGPNGRALLFLHGTFSTTTSAFGQLALQPAFARLEARYGDAIYGFDHYSVSASPAENATELLRALGPQTVEFDVVTHSRGGLVLRTLAECGDQLDADVSRFRLGHAILVASPNEGTALATPSRLNATIEWLANLLDFSPIALPDAPALATWIGWLLKVGIASAPGLDAMNADSESLKSLQASSKLDGSYSALVSNYRPDDGLLARMVDLGIDVFFDEANDLVVPTAGGWRVDNAVTAIPAQSVGCFGDGGNIEGEPVSHVGFFDRPETAEFIARVVHGEPTGLQPIALDKSLTRRSLPKSWRLADAEPMAAPDASAPRPPMDEPKPDRQPRRAPDRVLADPDRLPHILDLIVVQADQAGSRRRRADPDQEADKFLGAISNERQTVADGPATTDRTAPQSANVPVMVATYRGARVTVPFHLSGQLVPNYNDRGDPRTAAFESMRVDYDRELIEGPGRRWHRLIEMHRTLKDYVNGDSSIQLPSDKALRHFGYMLFEMLLPQRVRRLYDIARTAERERLVVVFTSMVDWVSDIPWEFARDPDRKTYLAMDDVHFVRNVTTPIPIERLSAAPDRLRLLLAIASPRGMTLAAADDEAARIKRELSSGDLRQLIEVEELEETTVERLHHALASQPNGRSYDILHFIGHGFAENGRAGLVFEDGEGRARRVDDSDLQAILAERKLRVVFLNACDTGAGVARSDQRYAIGGTAQTLFSRGIPVVVANQLKVRDQAAARFSADFYRYLAHGLTIAEATREARIAASYAHNRESIDWAIPVVYARDAGGRLVNRL